MLSLCWMLLSEWAWAGWGENSSWCDGEAGGVGRQKGKEKQLKFSAIACPGPLGSHVVRECMTVCFSFSSPPFSFSFPKCKSIDVYSQTNTMSRRKEQPFHPEKSAGSSPTPPHREERKTGNEMGVAVGEKEQREKGRPNLGRRWWTVPWVDVDVWPCLLAYVWYGHPFIFLHFTSEKE